MGNSKCDFHFELMYETGKYVKKDVQKTIKRYQKAAQMQCQEARDLLKQNRQQCYMMIQQLKYCYSCYKQKCHHESYTYDLKSFNHSRGKKNQLIKHSIQILILRYGLRQNDQDSCYLMQLNILILKIIFKNQAFIIDLYANDYFYKIMLDSSSLQIIMQIQSKYFYSNHYYDNFNKFLLILNKYTVQMFQIIE
ncbi:unnamed protein product [Paramecium sonneborni]|uniref:Uncharacterized protein n=1 Tax=Paramecium sonneborni TaxID=65129 RepID=A0A8S1PPF5_9CILI|nr:unnamed protein product [Paramecium sonneborni]